MCSESKWTNKVYNLVDEVRNEVIVEMNCYRGPQSSGDWISNEVIVEMRCYRAPQSPFTLTFHPHNNPVKAIILNNFKILQNDPETGAIFSQPPLISFKRDKNVGNFLVKSTFKTIEKPGTFKCAHSRRKTCPFVQNADKISGPKRSVKITDRFTMTKMTKTHRNQSRGILISLTILKNTCLSAAFPYIRVPQTAAKT